MTSDQLEWLPLSPPPQPKETQNKISCPHCHKTAPTNADTCPHCGRPLIPAALTPETLPQVTLPKRQFEILPPPDDWFTGRSLDTPAMYDLRLQAERLRVSGGFERLICLDDINIDHYQYQLEAAQRALRDMGGRALLADEVGLGKTIEAAVYHLTLSPPERKLYNGVTGYIREELRQAQQLPSGERKTGGALRLRLMTLQKQLASSPQAAAQGLEKLVARQNDDRLNDCLALARSIEQGRKVKAVPILEQYPHKTFIFTDYLASMRAPGLFSSMSF